MVVYKLCVFNIEGFSSATQYSNEPFKIYLYLINIIVFIPQCCKFTFPSTSVPFLKAIILFISLEPCDNYLR